LVSTIHYVANDSLALNLGRERRFEQINEAHFERLAHRMEAPPKFVLDIVEETVANARKAWPALILEGHLPEDMRDRLRSHWRGLAAPLRIS
jgi:serine/threonine-protein kinase HipA